MEDVAKAVGGGYCRLQLPLKLALGVRGTVAGRRLGALEGGAPQCIPAGGGGGSLTQGALAMPRPRSGKQTRAHHRVP